MSIRLNADNPTANLALVAQQVTTPSGETVVQGATGLNANGVVLPGGAGTPGQLVAGDVTAASAPNTTYLQGASGVAGGQGSRGNIDLLGGYVTGTVATGANAPATLVLSAPTVDGNGGQIQVYGGINEGKTSNAGLINIFTGESIGASSVSGSSPATTSTAGDTLIVRVDGEATQTITLGTNASGAAVAADIQAKVRALTAAIPANQISYSQFTSAFTTVYTLIAHGDSGAISGNKFAATLAITGGTLAAALKLGIANGGTEVSGNNAQLNVTLGQGISTAPSNTLALNTGGFTIGSGTYQIGGTQIASSNLSDSSSIVKTGTAAGGYLSGTYPNPNVAKVVGVSTNSNATAGDVGEYVVSTATNVSFPASTQYGDATSISLTAGDWDVSVAANTYITSLTTDINIGASINSGNSSAGLNAGDSTVEIVPAASATQRMPATIPAIRFSLSGTTTIYLKMSATYTSTAPQLNCRLSARRVR